MKTERSVPKVTAATFRPAFDAYDGNLFLLECLPEPDCGFYFLNCAVCDRMEFWSFKSTSPNNWVDFEADELHELIYPLPPYLCDICKRKQKRIQRDFATYSSYDEYLRSEHWQQMRSLALQRAGYKCQLCSSTEKLNVHHNTYARLGAERLSDLLVLCNDCHKNFHGILEDQGK